MTNELLSNFRVMVVNWRYGGLNAETGDEDWRHTVNVINSVNPHIVLCAEVDAGPVRDLWAHARRTAIACGMELAVLGPSAAVRSALGNNTAILVRTTAGLKIHNQWPPMDGTRACWCSAEIEVPGLEEHLHVYALHLHARSALARLLDAETIASIPAEFGQLAFVGGDFNGFPRHPVVPQEVLQSLPLHLQLTRCIQTPDGELVANHAVHDEFTRAGMVDLAAHLEQTGQGPADLQPTAHGEARVDRGYGTAELAGAVRAAKNLEIGSDHDAPLYFFDLTALAA